MKDQSARGRPKKSEQDIAAATRLRTRREQLRLAPGTVANAVGVNRPRYRYWERNLGRGVLAQHGDALAAALGVELRWLSHGEGQTPTALHPPREIGLEPLDPATRAALGARAKARRKALFLSVARLANLAEIQAHIVVSWERTMPARPNGTYVSRWEAALQCPANWLLDPKMVTPDLSRGGTITQECASVAELIRETGRWLAASRAARVSGKPFTLDAERQRHADIFSIRYGVLGEENSTLQSIGDRWAVTRERIRQIMEKLLARAGEVKMPRHAIERLAEKVQDRLPATVEDLDCELRAELGESLSVTGADRFARDILGVGVLVMEDGMAPAFKARITAMAVDPSQHHGVLARAVRDIALRMISVCGAGNLFMVAGLLAADGGAPVSADAVRRALVVVEGFSWLSEGDGWFWFGVNPRNRVIDVATKILAVAKHRLDVEDIHAGVARSRRFRPDLRITADLPIQVMAKLLSATPGIRTVQQNDFVLEQKRSIEQALSGTELQLYDLLAAHGGILDRNTLFRRLVKRGSMTLVSMQVALDQSPIISRVDYGIYALRGWPIDRKAIVRSLVAAERNRHGSSSISVHKDRRGKLCFRRPVTENMLKNSILELPVGIARACSEGIYILNGGPKSITLKKDVKGHARISTVVNVIRALEISAGSYVLITVDPQAHTIDVTPAKRVRSSQIAYEKGQR